MRCVHCPSCESDYCLLCSQPWEAFGHHHNGLPSLGFRNNLKPTSYINVRLWLKFKMQPTPMHLECIGQNIWFLDDSRCLTFLSTICWALCWFQDQTFAIFGVFFCVFLHFTWNHSWSLVALLGFTCLALLQVPWLQPMVWKHQLELGRSYFVENPIRTVPVRLLGLVGWRLFEVHEVFGQVFSKP